MVESYSTDPSTTTKIDESYSRDEYVYLAKLYEKAERFSDMTKWINKFIILNPVLNAEERGLLSVGYKNIISGKRIVWRLLYSQEKKEDNTSSLNLICLREVRSRIEDEIRKICDDIQEVLNKYLIPNAKDTETKVFYLKFQADYFRYRAEFTLDEEFKISSESAERTYKEAYAIAEKELHIANPIRLGLALNFSVLYYEILLNKEAACDIANSAIQDSMKILDDLQKQKAKDTILLIQLLKENILLWNSDNTDDE